MKFRNKILLAIWGVVLVLLMITFVLVNYWMRAQIEARFTDDIRSNYSTIREVSSLRAEREIKSCQTIAETPKLMAVTELGDRNTALQLSRELNGSFSRWQVSPPRWQVPNSLKHQEDTNLWLSFLESERFLAT